MRESKLFRGPFTKHSENVAIADTGDYEGLLTVEDSEGRTVYQVFGDDEQDEVNADFVLRALNCHEDLLAACKQTIAAGIRNDSEGCTPETIMLKAYAWKAMKAAIAKAEGTT